MAIEVVHVDVPLWFWAIFHGIILVMLYIDLRHYEKAEHSFQDALKWTIIWIVVGLAFSGYVYLQFGLEEFVKYLTAYAAEKMLSLDNIFVFLAIFTYFSVPVKARPFALFVGILFAIIFRMAFIFIGVALLERFSWMVYVFGLVLIYSGYKMAKGAGKGVDPSKNKIVRLAQRFLPIHPEYQDGHFTVKIDGRRFFTPLVLVLLAIETTDIMFAFDSVPAVLAITRNFFTAYTSNIMAILGLRALYFVVEAGVMKLKHLDKGLAIYLVYLGIAFMLHGLHIEIPTWVSLMLILAIFGYAFATREK